MKYVEKYNRYIDNDCVIYRKNREEKLVQVKPSTNNSGYEFICYKRRSIVLVHRLVYEAFKGKIPEGLEIDHIDRNKHNNNPDNLRVVTKSENCKNRVFCAYSRSEFGKKFVARFGFSKKGNPNLYEKELHWYHNHNKKCRWE